MSFLPPFEPLPGGVFSCLEGCSGVLFTVGGRLPAACGCVRTEAAGGNLPFVSCSLRGCTWIFSNSATNSPLLNPPTLKNYDAAGFALGKLTIHAGHISSAGAKQSYVSTLNYRIIRLANSSTVASGSQSYDYTGTEVFFARTFTLTGELLAGESYRLEVGMNNLVSGGAFAIYDGLSLEAYPEPSSAPGFAQRLNYAKYQKASASVQASSYFTDFALDGIVSNFHSWRVGSTAGPHWLEITYPRPVTLGSAHLYSGLLLASTTQVWQHFRFTPFGELYAGWDGVTSLVNHKSHHLHSKSAYRRVHNPASGDAGKLP